MTADEMIASLEPLPREDAIAQLEGAILANEIDQLRPQREIDKLRLQLLRLRACKR